jgi:hypothetical protein
LHGDTSISWKIHHEEKGTEPVERAKMELHSKKESVVPFSKFSYISVGWGLSRANFNDHTKFDADTSAFIEADRRRLLLLDLMSGRR